MINILFNSTFSIASYRSNYDDNHSTSLSESQISIKQSEKRSQPISNMTNKKKRSSVIDSDHDENIPTDDAPSEPTAPSKKRRRRY